MLFPFLLCINLLEPETYFFEPFDEDTLGTRWIPSKSAHFDGTWAIEERKIELYSLGAKGLVAKNAKTYHGVTAHLKGESINKKFVVQFEVKIQEEPWTCGGAYLKIFGSNFEQELFDEKTRYMIMFGPDKCFKMNKVHLILQTRNPKSGEWSEHALADAPTGKFDNLTHLYTLVINPDDTYKIKVDQRIVSEGDMHKNGTFTPSFTPNKTIPDASERKPRSWVDNEEIDDPEDIKPEDWNEESPQYYLDPYAKQPEGWLEGEPILVMGMKPMNVTDIEEEEEENEGKIEEEEEEEEEDEDTEENEEDEEEESKEEEKDEESDEETEKESKVKHKKNDKKSKENKSSDNKNSKKSTSQRQKWRPPPPDDWDEERDGVWQPPLVVNPKCLKGPCGRWQPQTIANPAYRGKYVRKKIKNPAYKGEWKPQMVPNPYYFVQKRTLSNLGRISGVGFDLLVDTADLMFDNIYLGDDEDEANEIAEEFWLPRYKKEYADWRRREEIKKEAERWKKFKKSWFPGKARVIEAKDWEERMQRWPEMSDFILKREKELYEEWKADITWKVRWTRLTDFLDSFSYNHQRGMKMTLIILGALTVVLVVVLVMIIIQEMNDKKARKKRQEDIEKLKQEQAERNRRSQMEKMRRERAAKAEREKEREREREREMQRERRKMEAEKEDENDSDVEIVEREQLEKETMIEKEKERKAIQREIRKRIQEKTGKSASASSSSSSSTASSSMSSSSTTSTKKNIKKVKNV
ncbi:putative calnexin [Monocercomonoides exilis]|uniref:putative calnexin n=1 Tax=Monocercomonoides exilis TaxID=2049356 RepID=UPI003559C75A|nr:putative calnexin [Monocercomonoides exilis]|eukprot:MONOS_9011.1-p1 / transcript=MONOS_9011.1 / gene=MONOS_9011 / organism=Monocercomonoides_exilis_PA203 / gene_product=calnexin / transcript_product=calnexin / location=Mono_scaffold00357:29565-32070(+) / protein_length=750 / sequence_SO=supercontig / SO=protein_coding / is_pseudo=false